MGLLDKAISSLAKSSVDMVKIKATEKVTTSIIDSIASVAVKAVENNAHKAPLVTVPNSSNNYIGQDYHTVYEELKAYGFSDISLLPKRDLINGILRKYGTIDEISIAGKYDFNKKTRFRADDKVVITYHIYIDPSKNPDNWF